MINCPTSILCIVLLTLSSLTSCFTVFLHSLELSWMILDLNIKDFAELMTKTIKLKAQCELEENVGKFRTAFSHYLLTIYRLNNQ